MASAADQAAMEAATTPTGGGGAEGVAGGAGGAWTEARIINMLIEHEGKIGMIQQVMRELAIKTDENAGRITDIPITGQSDIQGAGPSYENEMTSMKEVVRNLEERSSSTRNVLDEVGSAVQEMKENVAAWMDTGPPGLRNDEERRDGGRRDDGYRRGWDTRKLKLEPFDGDRKEFRSWAFTMKAFIRREAPVLEAFITESEYHEEEITMRQVTDMGVDPAEDKELAWILTNYTSGEIKELIQLNEGKPGCEMWRLLVKEANPKSGTSGVQAMQKLMSPGRSKGYQELKKLLAKWDALLKAEVQRGGPASKLGDEVKATAIISMVPQALEEEILKKGKRMVENYQEVRQFVDDMVYMHNVEGSSGPGISLSNVEDEEDGKEVEIADEQGNILVGTITMRNGKRIFQPRPYYGGKNGGGKGGQGGQRAPWKPGGAGGKG